MPLTPDEQILFSTALPFLNRRPLVFDVGAYKGEYSEYVLSVCPGADCYLFEPNTELFNELKNKYQAFNILISDVEDNVTFYQCPSDTGELSSLIKRPVFDDIQITEQKVKSTSIDNFCTYNFINLIHFLKIDVEGAELKVLNGCSKMLREKRIIFLQVEYGGTYPDAGITFLQVTRLMNMFGYNIYELVDGKLIIITEENFIEDYRYTNFLITYHDLG